MLSGQRDDVGATRGREVVPEPRLESVAPSGQKRREEARRAPPQRGERALEALEEPGADRFGLRGPAERAQVLPVGEEDAAAFAFRFGSRGDAEPFALRGRRAVPDQRRDGTEGVGARSEAARRGGSLGRGECQLVAAEAARAEPGIADQDAFDRAHRGWRQTVGEGRPACGEAGEQRGREEEPRREGEHPTGRAGDRAYRLGPSRPFGGARRGQDRRRDRYS